MISNTIRGMEPWERKNMGITQRSEEAVEELNFRLREAAIGYQLENGMVVRVDSQFLHQEVVRPALQILRDPLFQGAQEEFLRAHAHYRAGEYKDAIVNANEAFESTLKSICDVEDWSYPANSRASNLLKIIRRENLLPDYLDLSVDQLAATLQSG